MIRHTRTLFLFGLVVGLYFLAAESTCIRASLAKMPTLIEVAAREGEYDTVVIITDDDVCNICPSGKAVTETRGERTFYVLPVDTTPRERDGFRLVFGIDTLVMADDGTVAPYVQRLNRCAGHDGANVIVAIDRRGKKLRIEESF